MFAESYIQTATQIFNEYSLQLPLAVYLKKFFKSNPRFGSRDRKYIAELVYGIYRLGKNQHHLSVRSRLLSGSFLSGNLPVIFFEKTDRQLAENYHLPFAEKKKFVAAHYKIIFDIPYKLTYGMTEEEYIEYLFQPSKVFIRIRKHQGKIIEILGQKEVSYTMITDTCLSLLLNTKVQEVLPDTDEYVIQDYASQLAGNFFNPVNNETWWDCCAASGGKSLLLLDKNKNINLTVSDIRASIIENLHERFRQYNYRKYRAFVIDVSKGIKQDFAFDKIIADVPCSGGGTWGRNPEQFYFFDEEKLNAFHELQKKILGNVLTHLKAGGTLYYFTCSIFAEENEVVISTIDENKYRIVQQQLLKGFQYGGDCLYFCEIRKK